MNISGPDYRTAVFGQPSVFWGKVRRRDVGAPPGALGVRH